MPPPSPTSIAGCSTPTRTSIRTPPRGRTSCAASPPASAPASPAPSPIDDALARDDRDRLNLLLVDRCGHVDAVFATLDGRVQQQIGELVRSMSDGMVWSSETFARQGGVLADEEQLTRYCRNVIGFPAVFVIDLISDGGCPPAAREDAFEVSEMIQLANVTRDIETDLARGIAYHPALKPYLRSAPDDRTTRAAVREVREEYLRLALGRAGAVKQQVAEALLPWGCARWNCRASPPDEAGAARGGGFRRLVRARRPDDWHLATPLLRFA